MIEKLYCIVLARPYCQIDDIIIVIVINDTTTWNRPPSGTPYNGMRLSTIVSATDSDARRAVACLHPCHHGDPLPRTPQPGFTDCWMLNNITTSHKTKQKQKRVILGFRKEGKGGHGQPRRSQSRTKQALWAADVYTCAHGRG